jgi:hypothetical protein
MLGTPDARGALWQNIEGEFDIKCQRMSMTVGGCAVATDVAPDLTPDLTEICRLHAAYGYAIDRRDGLALAALFMPDGSMVMEGMDPVVGRAALANHIQNAPRGVHLVGFPHLREDRTAATAYTFTAAKFGRVISGYYYDTFARDDDGRLLFTRREISMPVIWQPPRADEGQR